MTARSQNGYTANDRSLTAVWKIPGTERTVRLRKGAPGQVLVLWAAWFDKHIEDIEAGQLDDWGYAERPVRGERDVLSNHASGTAIDLNATRHGLGQRDTFTQTQAAAIRARLQVFDGCIRWGGDYTRRKDEMHFEIAADPVRCAALVKKLTTPQEDDMAKADIDAINARLDKLAKEIRLIREDTRYDSLATPKVLGILRAQFPEAAAAVEAELEDGQ